MKKNKKLLIGIGIVVMLGIIAVGIYRHQQQATQDECIRIGVILPLTGSQAQYGVEARDALLLAEKVINREHRCPKELKLYIEDSHDNVRDATMAFNKLMTINPIAFIDAGSVVGLALAPLGEKVKKPILTLLASDEPIPLVSEWCFRAHLCAKDEAIQMARFAMDRLDAKKFSILYVNNSHGSVSSDFFTKEVVKKHGVVLEALSYEIGDVDVRAQVAKAIVGKPDAVYVFGYGMGYISCFNQLREAGFNGHILTMDALASESDQRATSGSNEGVYYTNSYFEKDLNESSRAFYQDYKQTYNVNPSHMAAIPYETLMLIASVFKAGAEDSSQLRSGLLQQKQTTTSIGDLSFSESRGLLVPLTIWRIQSGKPIRVK